MRGFMALALRGVSSDQYSADIPVRWGTLCHTEDESWMKGIFLILAAAFREPLAL